MPNYQRPEPRRQLMTISELSEVCGLSVRLLRRHVAARSIPYYKIGARVLFDHAEVDAWISAHKVEGA